MTLSPRECDEGLKTGLFALALALFIWLLSGCTPAGIRALCSDADTAGKSLVLARESLTLMLNTDAEAQWTVRCSQQDPEERRVCRHQVVNELAVQYKARYNAEAQVIQAQRLLANGLDNSGVCK
jgi:hypothetical protein